MENESQEYESQEYELIIKDYEDGLRNTRFTIQTLYLSSIIIYVISLFSMGWFVWYPAIAGKEASSYAHSPLLFFIILWIAVTLIPICIYILKMLNAVKKDKETKSGRIKTVKQIYLLEQAAENNKLS